MFNILCNCHVKLVMSNSELSGTKKTVLVPGEESFDNNSNDEPNDPRTIVGTRMYMHREVWQLLRIARGYELTQNEYIVRAIKAAIEKDMKTARFEENKRRLELDRNLEVQFLTRKTGDYNKNAKIGIKGNKTNK
jgi:hypothetical protein